MNAWGDEILGLGWRIGSGEEGQTETELENGEKKKGGERENLDMGKMRRSDWRGKCMRRVLNVEMSRGGEEEERRK